MITTHTTRAVATAAVVILIAGLIEILGRKLIRAVLPETQQAKIATTVEKVRQANAGLPDPQVQAETLIFPAMIQKQIPAAVRRCDTLNVGGKPRPITPTNITFALNSRVAELPYSKTNRPRSDVVVLFETAKPGWNLAGDSELLAHKPEGVAVALADGRAMLVTHTEAVHLR